MMFARNALRRSDPGLGKLEMPLGPRPGDILRLGGFGGQVTLQDGQKVSLQTLLNISVSGVVIMPISGDQAKASTAQPPLAEETHQQLTNSGFGVYTLKQDSPGDNASSQSQNTSWGTTLFDETSSLIAALGFEKDAKGEPARGIVAIAKDGRVLTLASTWTTLTLKSVTSLVHLLGSLDRTPSQ